MSEIVFSVIIPTYNRANFVVEAINSVLNQTYKLPYEVIVVDDGSIDKTEKILLEYMKKEPRLKFIKHEKNKGSAARNTGIIHSKGKYLLFLDSDDKLLPNALSIFAKAINTFPDGEVFIGRVIRENHKGEKKLAPISKLSGNNKKDFKSFLKTEKYQCLQVLL